MSSTLLPLFDAPQWLTRSMVILLAVGFVPALIFSWMFELTPEGLKRDAQAGSVGRAAWDRMIFVALELVRNDVTLPGLASSATYSVY